MKTWFNVALVATGLGMASTLVHASQYGCQVLLCLSNPASNGGPRGVAECRPIIDRLYDDLRHGRPFPTCDISDGNDGRSFARQVFDYYDPCPADTKAAQPGPLVAEETNGAKKKPGAFLGFGVAQGVQASPTFENGRGPRACVAQFVRSYQIGTRRDENLITVNVYRKVIWQQPQSPRAIDVFIDGSFSHRVRW